MAVGARVAEMWRERRYGDAIRLELEGLEQEGWQHPRDGAQAVWVADYDVYLVRQFLNSALREAFRNAPPGREWSRK